MGNTARLSHDHAPSSECSACVSQFVWSFVFLLYHLKYDIDVISRYMQKPHEIHWNDSKRIMHYVQGTRHFGVHYVVGSPLELVGFSNYDWVGDPIEMNSTSVYVFMLSHGTIFYSSKKQHIISLSSAEAEYRGAVNATTQCLWLQGILQELGVALDSPIVIWCDNKSAIMISIDPIQI